MRRRSIVLISTALGLMLMVAPAVGQWSPRETGSAGYEGSTLMETPSGESIPISRPFIIRTGPTTWTRCSNRADIIR